MSFLGPTPWCWTLGATPWCWNQPGAQLSHPRQFLTWRSYLSATGVLIAALILQHVISVGAERPPVAVADNAFTAAGAGGNSIPGYLELPPVIPPKAAVPAAAPSTKAKEPADVSPATQAVRGIPGTVLAAYHDAEENLESLNPDCHLSTALLAIGRVESGHAQGGNVDAKGTTLTRILGPRLDGSPGIAAIRDTDGGRLDGDAVWDRAVGPMQFIPSTWRRWASDGNRDGVSDPSNVYDAALAAGRYLCAAGGDLSTPDGLRHGVLAYNHSEQYLAVVVSWMQVYSGGAVAVPDRKSASSNHSRTASKNAQEDSSDRRVSSKPSDRSPQPSPDNKEPRFRDLSTPPPSTTPRPEERDDDGDDGTEDKPDQLPVPVRPKLPELKPTESVL